jgi:hypothetical protein
MAPVKVQDYPFRHIVLDGWWPIPDLRAVLAEFPAPTVAGWRRYSNSTERKLEGPPGLRGGATRSLFSLIHSRAPQLEELFGIEGLTMETIGGGYHLIEPGGYLNVHSDFSISPNTRRYRRLNLLIYLNDGWDDPGGHLELWDDDGKVTSIAPEFNRTVIFETSATSWHGHPTPASRWRKSVAAYFFTEQPPPDFAGEQSTVWWDQR